MSAAYIPADGVRIVDQYCGVLIIKRRRARIGESGGRIPDGMTLEGLRRLHAERRLRWIHHPLHTELLITEPSARGWF